MALTRLPSQIRVRSCIVRRGGTLVIERYLAAIFVVGIAGNELFHAIFDVMDFGLNAQIVNDVISMKYTFDPQALRAIHNPLIGQIGYGLIWVTHLGSGVVALLGGLLLIQRPRKGRFDAHGVAILGVGIGAVLYLVGFMTIAGGWFLLYSAPTPPNYVGAAMLSFLCYVAVLIYLQILRRDAERSF